MKKTLLIAVAALAAGIISTQAQAVYSQNIVGYVNQTIPGNYAFSLIAAPLNGATNNAEAILPAMQGGELIYIWNGGGYYTYQYYQGLKAGGYPSDWVDTSGTSSIPGDVYDSGSGFYFAPEPVLQPGQAFFLQNPNSTYTNTYTGTVVVSTTNTPTSLAGNYAFSLVSSAVPVAGDLETNTVINLPLQGGELIYIWNGGGYYTYQYYQGLKAGGYPSDWVDTSGTASIPGDVYDSGSGFYFAPSPTISVGQGFFYQNPNTTTNWVQTLP